MVCRTMTVSSGETDKTGDKMRVESFTGQSLGYTRTFRTTSVAHDGRMEVRTQLNCLCEFWPFQNGKDE